MWPHPSLPRPSVVAATALLSLMVIGADSDGSLAFVTLLLSAYSHSVADVIIHFDSSHASICLLQQALSSYGEALHPQEVL